MSSCERRAPPVHAARESLPPTRAFSWQGPTRIRCAPKVDTTNCSSSQSKSPATDSLAMRWLLHLLFLSLLGVAQAVGSQGSRLLVVLEDAARKGKYSQLWQDLECTFQSVKEKRSIAFTDSVFSVQHGVSRSPSNRRKLRNCRSSRTASLPTSTSSSSLPRRKPTVQHSRRASSSTS